MLELNIDEALKKSGHGVYNYAVLTVCSLINHATAIDILGFGVVLPVAMCDLQLGMTESGLLVSVPFAGFIFALPWGYYADIQGRRRAILLSSSLGFVFAVATSFAPNWQTLVVLKFLGCSFSSACITLTMTYLGECTVDEHRSRYMFIMNSFNLASDIVVFGLAYFILPLDFNLAIPWLSITFRPWRAFVIAMAIPLGLGYLMMLFLYESPKFLANVGKSDKALAALKNIHKINGLKGCYPIDNLAQNAEKSKQSFWSSIVSQTVPIFKPPLLLTTIQLFYLFTICYTTINVFYIWFPLFVNSLFSSLSVNEDKSFCERITSNISTYSDTKNGTCNDNLSNYTIYSGIIYSLFFTVLNLGISAFARWRKFVLISTFVVSAACCILLNLIRQPIVNVVLLTLVQITGIGIGNVSTYFIDMYPTTYRGLVTSLGMMVAKLASFGGVNLLGAFIIEHCILVFYSWAAFVITGIAVALFLPADRKKS